MEDTRLRLPVALILIYKRSTHAKEKGELSTKNKNRKETREKHNPRAKLRAALEENLHKSIGNPVFLSLVLFSCLFFNYEDVFDG